MTVCPACAAQNADDARFCSQLRAAARGRRGRLARPSGRLVTVLFATSRGRRRSARRSIPKTCRTCSARTPRRCARRSRPKGHGREVHRRRGDGGRSACRSRTRTTRRGRFARSRGCVAGSSELNGELERPHGVRLAMRIGVNTGDVVASRELRSEVGMVTGDAVNAALVSSRPLIPGRSSSPSGPRARRAGSAFRERRRRSTVRGKSRPVATVELLDERARAPGEPSAASRGCARRWSAATTSSMLLRSTYGRLAVVRPCRSSSRSTASPASGRVASRASCSRGRTGRPMASPC